jgi:hypothetical protein
VADSDDFGGFDDDLIEIERASAILHQRDPSQAAEVVNELRARREEELRREEAARKIREIAAKRRSVRRKRLAIVAGVVLAVGIAAVPLTRAVMHEAARAKSLQEILTEASLPVKHLRFGVEAEWLDVPPAGVAFEVPRNTCSILVGVAEGEHGVLAVRLARQGLDPVEHKGGLIWCSCDKEQATASFVTPGSKRVALRWLNAKMGTVGGIEVLTSKEIPSFRVLDDPRAYGCADAAFSVWAQAAGNASLSPLDERFSQALEALKRELFVPMGILKTDQRFGVVSSRAQRCYLVLPFGEKAPVTLRNAEGRRVIEDSQDAMGWCTYKSDRAYSVWRKNPGPPQMLVLEADAKRIGGVAGLKEAAMRHGAKRVATLLEHEDLQADALAALVASGVSEEAVTQGESTGLPGKPNSRAVAFSLYDTSSFLPDVSPRVPVACDPKPLPGHSLQAYVCVQAQPQKWRREGSVETQGAAEGRLPFWLSLLADSNDERVLPAMATMLAFSRRMTLLGFEPTTIDGVKDSAIGGEVLGRPEKTEALSVGLTRRPPWIHPLTHGPVWKLDGDLPIISVKMGESVRVRSVHGSLTPTPQERRVIVWRR